MHAQRDLGLYPTSVSVSDRDLARIPIRAHEFHGEWNYTITPRAASPAGRDP